MQKRDVGVLKRHAVARKRSDADQCVAERIDGETQERQEITDFVTLEETAKMKHGDVARFEGGGDLVEPPIRAAKHGLIAQAHTVALQLADGRRNPFFLV